MTDTTNNRKIDGLPTRWNAESGKIIDLSVVPDSPSSDADPRRPELIAQYQEWYREIRRYRAERWILIDHDDFVQRIEWEKCRRDPTYFITMYCFVYEVREDQGAGNSFVPAIPFPFQYDLVRWFQERLRSTGAAGNGFVSKSRDMGATWFAVLFAMHQFIFDEPFSVKLISRREDLVDDPGNMDSMMERISANMEMIPPSLLPHNWSVLLHRSKLKIRRPGNRNLIAGESTSARSGRGGRSRLIVIDEGAFIEKIRQLLSSVMMTSSHVVVITSESVEFGTDYLDFKESLKLRAPEAVLELDYWLHPYHDQQWLADTKDRYGADEAGFQREVLREAWSGLSTLLYPKARDLTALAEEWAYDDTGTTKFCVGFDPGWDDETAFSIGALDYVPGRDLIVDGFEARQLPPEFYAAILCGMPDDEILRFGAPYNVGLEACRLAEFFRRIPMPTVYGDPAGNQKHNGLSWFDKMILYWRNNNPRRGENGLGYPLEIRVSYLRFNADENKRGRRNATMKWLPRLDFNANQQARAVLTALQHSRFDEPTSRGRMSEQKTPRHDQYSHRRTTVEFMAVNLEIEREALQAGRPEPYSGVGTRATPVARVYDSATVSAGR